MLEDNITGIKKNNAIILPLDFINAYTDTTANKNNKIDAT